MLLINPINVIIWTWTNREHMVCICIYTYKATPKEIQLLSTKQMKDRLPCTQGRLPRTEDGSPSVITDV